MHTPRVTIGLPVFNGESFLEAAIESLLRQTFSDFELIISDNASTDGTEAMCRRAAARDVRVRYVRNDRNAGASANFNGLVEVARGRYFKWAAADDVCAPAFIERCVEALDLNPGTVLAMPATRLVDEHGLPLPYDASQQAFVDAHGKAWYWDSTPQPELGSPDPVARFRSVLLRSAWCLEVFGLIRTEVLKETSLIGSYFGSDRVLLTELSLRGRFEQIDETLFDRRCHPAQSTYRPARENGEWISGRRVRWALPPQAHAVRGYLRAIGKAEIPATRQIRGTAAVAELALRPDKLRRLLLPGPDNYFGLRRPLAAHTAN